MSSLAFCITLHHAKSTRLIASIILILTPTMHKLDWDTTDTIIQGLNESKARKEQSEKMASQLSMSLATPVDAYILYIVRYCPAVSFYYIPISHFTTEQCNAIQSPFMNALLPKMFINRHVKRAVIWGPKKYRGLELAHMATEQMAKIIESVVGHVRASMPTGTTF